MNTNLIIVFHNVTDSDWFDRIIKYLKSKYNLVTAEYLEQAILKGEDLRNICHITFDDGEKSFYNIAYQILKKHNVPATIFVSPKIITNQENFWFQEIRGFNSILLKQKISEETNLSLKDIEDINPMSILKCLTIDDINGIIKRFKAETNSIPAPCQNMSESDLKEVYKAGLITIGAHTLNHPILKNEENDICLKEIADSINNLGNLLNTKIKYFAYPNGLPGIDYGEREIRFLKENQISLAFSGESRTLTSQDDVFSLPRIGLSYGNILFVKLKLFSGNKWEVIKSIRKSNELKERQIISSLLKKA
jgi:peptidoglycan/xylan/chitin deacetylase (PgdA/CDA1 family)